MITAVEMAINYMDQINLLRKMEANLNRMQKKAKLDDTQMVSISNITSQL